jgi:glycerol uptake facilitator protein
MREEPAPLPRRLAAEAVGTALLVFVGVGAVPALILFDQDAKSAFSGPSLGFVALAFGLIVAGLVYTIGKVSGCHINPAVTIAFAATRRFPWRDVPPYAAAQLAGATAGAFLIWGVFGDRATRLGYGFGVVNFDRAVTSWGSAMLAEALAAGILVFIVLGAIDRRSPHAVAGLVIGLALAAIIVTIGPVTNASTNPARSFGPLFVQTVNGSGTHNWLKFLFAYTPAEVIGAIAAAFLYDVIAKRPVSASRSDGSRSTPRAASGGSRWSGRRGPTTTPVTRGSARSQAIASAADETPRSAAAAARPSSPR